MPNDAPASPVAIDLASAPGFRLGLLEVRPATRQVVRGERSETVEPRVMQVLVALGEANGEVVSRDALIARCWGGAAVGDNAIHRVVSRLRELAAGLGEASFAIETVTKVGYRLVLTGSSAPTPQAPSRQASWHRLAAFGSAILLVALVAIVAWQWPRAPSPIAFAVVAETPGENAAAAQALADDLVRLMAPRAPRLSVAGPDAAGQADYLIRHSVEREGSELHAGTSVVSTDGVALLWSARFERPVTEAGLLRREIASRVGALALCVSRRREARRLDVDAMRLLLSICDRIDQQPDEALLTMLRALIAREPDFGWAWGEIAVAEAEIGTSFFDPRNLRTQSLRESARRSIVRARSIEPNLGSIWLAEYVLTPAREWDARLRLLDRGQAVDGGEARLHMARVRLMEDLGFFESAVGSAHNAVANDPLSHLAHNTLISTLSYSGHADAARRALEEAEQLWPGSPVMTEVRRRFDLRQGDPEAALVAIQGSPNYGRQQVPFLRARADPTPANVEAALATARRTTAQNPGATIWYVQTLGTFGRTEEFYTFASDPRIAALFRDDTNVLFRSHMRSLWMDRRFMALMARIGLARFWLRRNAWPDFCSDPQLSYDCRSEARRTVAELG